MNCNKYMSPSLTHTNTEGRGGKNVSILSCSFSCYLIHGTVLFVFWGLGWLTAFPGAVRFTEVFSFVHLIVFGTPFDGLLWAQEIKHHFYVCTLCISNSRFSSEVQV